MLGTRRQKKDTRDGHLSSTWHSFCTDSLKLSGGGSKVASAVSASVRGDVRRSSNMFRRVPLRNTTLRLTMKEKPSLLVTRIQSSWLALLDGVDDMIQTEEERVSDISK